MKVTTLSWVAGENNPFEYFNKGLRNLLSHFGVVTSEIVLDEDLLSSLLNVAKGRIDIAITHQGIASKFRTSKDTNLWDELDVPLLSLHGDHPCHAPVNHLDHSKMIKHVYAAPSFARYAEQHFSRRNPVYFSLLPNFFNYLEEPQDKSGQYFVLPMNRRDITETREKWRREHPEQIYLFLLKIFDELKENYTNNDRYPNLDFVDFLLTQETLETFCSLIENADQSKMLHYIHHCCFVMYRHIATDMMMDELVDVPLKIYGSGWQTFKSRENPKHQFFDGSNLDANCHLYQSEFGVIDICHVGDGIHDRTMRAMANECGFLSNSRFDFDRKIGNAGHGLFFTGEKGNLRDKVERVMEQPDDHRNRIMKFKSDYDRIVSPDHFYNMLCMLAKK